MYRIFACIVCFLASSAALYPVTTRFINDFPFDKLSSYQLSNVSLTEQGGLELARSYEVLYRSEGMLWSLAFWQGRILVGTADQARVLEIQGTESREVFRSEGDLIISDMEGVGSRLYLSTLPQSRVLALGADYKIQQEWSVTNKYIWDIVPHGETLYILCGNPAALYSIHKGILSSLAEISLEDNLLNGMVYQDKLYFSGERYLYRYDGRTVTPLAGFDNPVTGLLQHQGSLYLVTATHDPSVSANPSGNGSTDKNSGSDSKPYYGESALYRVSLSGRVELLYKRKNIQFVSLTLRGDTLLIGTGKDAGYLEYSLDGSRKSFTSLGSGKFITTILHDKDVYGVLLQPTRIVRIGQTFAGQGYFISDMIDTENISRWGSPVTGQELLPGTGVSYYTRSSLIGDNRYWDPWKTVTDRIQSSPGRYFQYRITLTSQGQNSPRVKSLSIPFVQDNLPPRIENISIKYEKQGLQVSWNTRDENKDQLNYDIYLALVEGPWVRLNQLPLSEESYTLEYRAYPAGSYRVQVVARDNWSNPPALALQHFLVSDPFIIDNQVPVLAKLETELKGQTLLFRFSAEDSQTPLSWAGYSLNGSPWKHLLPRDGMLDQLQEVFEHSVDSSGPVFLQIGVRDSLGNETVTGRYIP